MLAQLVCCSGVVIGGRAHHRVRVENVFVYAELHDGSGQSSGDATARQLWPAARSAARFVADYIRRSDRALTTCELGCGLGAPSLAAARAGASALATDVDTQA